MSESRKQEWTETLPEPLPANPLQLAADWLAQARADAAQPNPNSMVLATVDGRGQPSARVVLCKDIAAEAGFITFYTNYLSRKGRKVEASGCLPPKATRISAAAPGRAVSAPGPAGKANRSSRATRCARRWRMPPGRWAFHTAARVRKSRSQ